MLHPCPDCKQSVSETAETCPHCGYRLLGRAHLVPCPHCGADVLAEVHPHDTISRYCPICKRPITNPSGRRSFLVISFVLFGLIFVTLTVVILYVFSTIGNPVLP